MFTVKVPIPIPYFTSWQDIIDLAPILNFTDKERMPDIDADGLKFPFHPFLIQGTQILNVLGIDSPLRAVTPLNGPRMPAGSGNGAMSPAGKVAYLLKYAQFSPNVGQRVKATECHFFFVFKGYKL